ncbi:hypothetical protein EDC01DRAFT_604998, partial [Geopyxis carbonaria]
RGQGSGRLELRQEDADGWWRAAKVQEWLDECTQFLEHLALLFYMVGGQPPRQKDLLWMRYRNTLKMSRNMYLHDGCLCFIANHNKTGWQDVKARYIPRFLPPHLTKLVVTYTEVVLPFRNYL